MLEYTITLGGVADRGVKCPAELMLYFTILNIFIISLQSVECSSVQRLVLFLFITIYLTIIFALDFAYESN